MDNVSRKHAQVRPSRRIFDNCSIPEFARTIAIEVIMNTTKLVMPRSSTVMFVGRSAVGESCTRRESMSRSLTEDVVTYAIAKVAKWLA